MSAIVVLATPVTATLSVMRTFISVPSRDLIVSIGAIDAFDGAADADRRRLLRPCRRCER